VSTVLGSAAAPATAAVASVAAATPAPASRDLLGVSCLTAKNCLAVGQEVNGLHPAGYPLAQTWNGAAWKLVPVRLPAGASAGALGQVSCLTATDCRAVGFSVTGKNQSPLGDNWNGKTWTPTRLPGIGGKFSALQGITCVSAASCVAVGYYAVNGPSAMALADIWRGGKWTQTRPPTPSTTLSLLFGVSCASVTFCVAVGEYFTSTASAGFIDSWNGKNWSRMAAAWPHGATGGYLTGVSCRPSKTCVAVGFANVGKGLVTVTEAWSGKGWALSSVPWPRGTANPELTGVSCAAANRCVAVAAINQNLAANSNQGTAGAATWNGKAWTVTTPTPAKGKASLFNGVTCLSTTSCVAVGQIGPTGGTADSGLSGFWNGSSWHLVTAM